MTNNSAVATWSSRTLLDQKESMKGMIYDAKYSLSIFQFLIMYSPFVYVLLFDTESFSVLKIFILQKNIRI